MTELRVSLEACPWRCADAPDDQFMTTDDGRRFCLECQAEVKTMADNVELRDNRYVVDDRSYDVILVADALSERLRTMPGPEARALGELAVKALEDHGRHLSKGKTANAELRDEIAEIIASDGIDSDGAYGTADRVLAVLRPHLGLGVTDLTDAKRSALNAAIDHVGEPWMHAVDGDAEVFERILAERGFAVTTPAIAGWGEALGAVLAVWDLDQQASALADGVDEVAGDMTSPAWEAYVAKCDEATDARHEVTAEHITLLRAIAGRGDQGTAEGVSA